MFKWLEDVDVGDATLTVVAGRNKLHSHVFTDTKDDNTLNWFISNGCVMSGVSAKAGSMILWNSKTVHMGLSPSKKRYNKNRCRKVVYVSMFPRSKHNNTVLKKRVEYFNEGRTTNHYGNKLFGKSPRTYGKELAQMNSYVVPILTSEGYKLI